MDAIGLEVQSLLIKIMAGNSVLVVLCNSTPHDVEFTYLIIFYL